MNRVIYIVRVGLNKSVLPRDFYRPCTAAGREGGKSKYSGIMGGWVSE